MLSYVPLLPSLLVSPQSPCKRLILQHSIILVPFIFLQSKQALRLRWAIPSEGGNRRESLGKVMQVVIWSVVKQANIWIGDTPLWLESGWWHLPPQMMIIKDSRCCSLTIDCYFWKNSKYQQYQLEIKVLYSATSSIQLDEANQSRFEVAYQSDHYWELRIRKCWWRSTHVGIFFSSTYNTGTDIDQTYVLLGSDNLENVALNSAKLKGGLLQVIDWSTADTLLRGFWHPRWAPKVQISL